jgi:phosphate transport system substrate-binding protein
MKNLKAILAMLILCGVVYAQELLGAGATFPFPYYSKIFSEYHKQTGVRVNYQSIGSGGGVQQILGATVDFGASDAFLSDEELSKAPRKLIHVPTCLGAVVLSFNIPGIKSLKLSEETLADIYLGKIKFWNDEKIKALNPSLKLPKLKIIVVRRSDGSGTTAIFTEYLAFISPEWKSKVGAGKSVAWPAGIGGRGNEGVAGSIKQMPGAIGYIELAYAYQNKMSLAALPNRSGNYVEPTLKNISFAAEGKIPSDTRVSLIGAPHPDAWPISGFTWLLVYEDQNYNNRDRKRGETLANLLWWVIHEGQNFAEALHYAKLPEGAKKSAEEIIKGIHFNGQKLLK